MTICNINLAPDDTMTFDPPLFSDAGSYWCRNRTNHSDIAKGILIFEDAQSESNIRIITHLLSYAHSIAISSYNILMRDHTHHCCECCHPCIDGTIS